MGCELKLRGVTPDRELSGLAELVGTDIETTRRMLISKNERNMESGIEIWPLWEFLLGLEISAGSDA